MEELRKELSERQAAVEAALLTRWAEAHEVSVGPEQDEVPAELDCQLITLRRMMRRHEEAAE